MKIDRRDERYQNKQLIFLSRKNMLWNISNNKKIKMAHQKEYKTEKEKKKDAFGIYCLGTRFIFLDLPVQRLIDIY